MTRLAFAISLGWILALAASLLPPAYGTARGDAPYRLQPIVRLGDLAGDVAIKAGGHFEIGALNDNRQVAFVTQDESGAKLLIQYAGGTLTPLVVPGRAAPGGTWSEYSYVLSPVSMNQQGNVAFAALVTMGDNIEYGTFRWDAEAQRLTAIALPGMPAVNNRTFSGAGGQTPVINNQNEIAFVGEIQNAAGTSQPGVFLLGRDGKLRPVALPDQELPGGGPISGAFVPSLNDAGVVAFFARRPANLVCDHLVFGWGLMARRLYYPAPRHLREPDLQLPNGGTAPEGLINAAFLDGHVKALKHEQFWEILPAYTHRGTPTSDVFRYFWPYE